VAKPVKKRTPKFEDFDEMLADVDSMLKQGYTKHGNWSLGQATSHVADWMLFPLDGFPVPPLPMRAMFWVMKHTVAPGMKRKILAEGFKGGTPTAPVTVADANAMSDEAGVEKLRNAVARVKRHFESNGEMHPSPLFGEMDHDMHRKVTLLHAEHHFGYLEPKT
jgi:hypothetical protein